MKTNSFIIAALSAVALSSCQVSLMTAVEQGDVVAVREALASGLQPGELNAAASVAYAKGNTVILDELMKSGAIAAPDGVAYKKVEIQRTWYRSDAEHSFERPEVSSPSLFAQYWANRGVNHVWEKDSSGHIETKDMSWREGNLFEEKIGDEYGENTTRLEYKRCGMNKGFIIYDFLHVRPSREYDNHTYYELTFDTPTSGTYKCLDREVTHFGYENWSIGRFWLKDVPQEPKKETKKSSKKKRR